MLPNTIPYVPSIYDFKIGIIFHHLSQIIDVFGQVTLSIIVALYQIEFDIKRLFLPFSIMTGLGAGRKGEEEEERGGTTNRSRLLNLGSANWRWFQLIGCWTRIEGKATNYNP